LWNLNFSNLHLIETLLPMKKNSPKKSPVSFGVVGLGNMGSYYARLLQEGKISGARLGATCDCDPATLERATPPGVPTFSGLEAMLASDACEVILIVTPHPSHAPLATLALRAGRHVLLDKPLAVHKAEAEKLLAIPRRPGQQFGLVFNQRTDPWYQKVRAMVREGKLGQIHRVSWTITNWFRTNAYYASGTWRATWNGEGGGVLINQSVHNLDLLCWIFGMPCNVRALALPGRHHPIEVEDEVSAIFQYADGKFINFVTSTGETPGVNRLEIAGSRGLLTLGDGELLFLQNEIDSTDFLREAREGYVRPEVRRKSIPLPKNRGPQHAGILANFAAAVRGREPLVAPAEEGLHSVELINATIQAGLTGKTISLPMSGASYLRFLRQLRHNAKPRKDTRVVDRSGWSTSHHFGQ
jgi:predicted dehydrogenase